MLQGVLSRLEAEGALPRASLEPLSQALCVALSQLRQEILSASLERAHVLDVFDRAIRDLKVPPRAEEEGDTIDGERLSAFNAPTLVEAGRDTAEGTLIGLDSGGGAAPLDARPVTRSRVTREVSIVSAPVSMSLPPRYDYLGRLGAGGMGEVHRVRDRVLGRTVALKAILPEHAAAPTALARFTDEAQLSAQLEHPGLVPVHDLDRLSDGRVYFTMQEVEGRALSSVIIEAHARAATDGQWSLGGSVWSLRQLITALLRVCDAIGYAHARGVIHRDLKPRNILVGDNGEVLVVDWGLGKVVGEEGEVLTARMDRPEFVTQPGQIAGTPTYMSPEQACGAVDRIGPASDVYALGGILFEMLTGRPPFEGTVLTILTDLTDGRQRSPRETSALPVPEDLERVHARATAFEIADRYPDAQAMAADLRAWLDGVRQRERALELVAQARESATIARALHQESLEVRASAEAHLAELPSWASEAEKNLGWTLEDEAARVEQQASRRSLEGEQRLHAALTYSPDLPAAHADLAALYQRRHEAAERERDAREALRNETMLRTHVMALSQSSEARRGFARYLEGTGAVTLVTRPSGAEVRAFRYERCARRLVLIPSGVLGRTPLRERDLEMGSYLLELHHPERAAVRYPVHIERGVHWQGLAPDAQAPTPVTLPRSDQLHEDEVYVPAGEFRVGGDPGAQGSFPSSRVWVDGFVIKKFPVTNREYIAFLASLVVDGREDDALRFAPRDRGATEEAGPLLYGYEGGNFSLREDTEGDAWMLDEPARMLDWFAARAYCAWLAARDGVPWRLPCELEWEKAARGVDGRAFPWGDALDPSWCCMRDSHRGRPRAAVVESFEIDASPYGVRGMGGNMKDWCADLFEGAAPARLDVAEALRRGEEGDEDAYRVVRGGSWMDFEQNCRVARRFGSIPTVRNISLGFRPCRSLGA